MAITDLKPFDGLSVLTSETDEIEVAHLLKVNELLGLICQDCGGKKFRVQAFIPTNMEVITGKHIIITRIDHKETMINRVVECVHCRSTDFVTITNSGDNNNGQEHSGTGNSG